MGTNLLPNIETQTQVLNDIPVIVLMLVRLGVVESVDNHVKVVNPDPSGNMAIILV